jgi:hypothetical protein
MVTSALGAILRNAVRPLSALDRSIRGGGDAEDPCGLVAHERLRHMKTDAVEPIVVEDAAGNG